MTYPEALTCEHPGCLEPTRERKPYCSDHIDDLPYIQELVARICERDEELERVARRGWKEVDPQGLTASEILLQLSLYGDRTVPRLCRDLQLDIDVAEGFAMALARRGMVTLGQTDRGHMKVALASVGHEALREFKLTERKAG
ncbi:MAG TPA: hypothetical protein DEA08_32430 [Planctomycetes bacterium]|nr:hypothetical protein [Planctomycetota bacterium]|tara:strand:- start:769 stop:1197 length:429 start_codon:yes stop_codon:yes gene_type:complete